ncbi:MGMT family protein [Pholiota molesta]|nr:MGMT family protein [Pholiota molesta]
MDSAEFHAAVYDLVRLIPPCRVTSYGHIAKLAGMPNHSRHVGQALKFLPPNTNPPIPWHRVIGASGTISDALVAEGVDVTTGRTGELRVDFGQYGCGPPPNSTSTKANSRFTTQMETSFHIDL